MARPKTSDVPPEWLVPYAPGKQFVIPNTVSEYKAQKCIEPVHIFLREAGQCKCKRYFWPATDQYTHSRTIRIPRND